MVTRFEAAQSQMRAAQMINEGQAERAEAELQRAEERLRDFLVGRFGGPPRCSM